MPRDEKPYPVVEIKIGGMILDHIFCDTQGAAEKAIEESQAKDPYGWYAEYAIKPMTRSEIAYLLAA